MTAYVSWIRAELARRFPHADLSKGVDLNGNGRLEPHECIVDANNNRVVGDHEDWVTFSRKNAAALTKLGGIFSWGSAFSADNPIHDIITIQRALATDTAVQTSYTMLGEMLREVRKRIAGGRFSPMEKLKIIYAVIRSHGIRLADNDTDPLFIGNLLSKHLDCDTSCLAVMAIAHELGIRVRLVTAPEHAFLRYDDGKGDAFNIDYGTIRTKDLYIKKNNVSPTSITQGVYLNPLDRRGLLSQTFLILAQGKMKVLEARLQKTAASNAELPADMLEDIQRDLDTAIDLDPLNVSAYHFRGNMLNTAGEPEKAIKDYTQAIAYDPHMHFTFGFRGSAYLKLGQYKKALDDLNVALSFKSFIRQPQMLKHYLEMRSNAYVSLGRFQDALRTADILLAMHQTDEYYATRGNLHLKLNHYAKAFDDFSQALKLNPKNLPCYYYRSQASMSQGHYRRTIADLDTIVKHGIKDPAVFVGRGIAKAKLELHEDAIEDFKRAINIGTTPQATFIAVLHVGQSTSALGKHREAIAILDRLITVTENFVAAYIARGKIHARLKNSTQALADFNKAIEIAPQVADGYLARAQLEAHLNMTPGAIADFRKVISIDPSNIDAYNGLATHLFAIGSAHKALDVYNGAIKRFPHNADLYVERGKIKLGMGIDAAAIADYTTAIELEPRNAKIRSLRGHAFLALHRCQEAIGDLEQAVALDPNSAESHRARAAAHAHLGMHNEAIRDISKAVALAPKKPDYRVERGSMYAAEGNKDLARADYTEALKLNPAHIAAKHQLNRTRYIPDIGISLKPRIGIGTASGHDALTSVGARWNVASIHKGLSFGIAAQTGYAGGKNHHVLDTSGAVTLTYAQSASRVSLDAGAGYGALLAGDTRRSPLNKGAFFTYGLRYDYRLADRIYVGATLSLQHELKDPKQFAIVPGAELTFNLW